MLYSGAQKEKIKDAEQKSKENKKAKTNKIQACENQNSYRIKENFNVSSVFGRNDGYWQCRQNITNRQRVCAGRTHQPYLRLVHYKLGHIRYNQKFLKSTRNVAKNLKQETFVSKIAANTLFGSKKWITHMQHMKNIHNCLRIIFSTQEFTSCPGKVWCQWELTYSLHSSGTLQSVHNVFKKIRIWNSSSETMYQVKMLD